MLTTSPTPLKPRRLSVLALAAIIWIVAIASEAAIVKAISAATSAASSFNATKDGAEHAAIGR
jgi:hypothetical protein